MFIHDNGNICVLAATRCGHTSLYDYFGVRRHSMDTDISDWISSKTRRILVLRNHIERCRSATITSLSYNNSRGLTKEQWLYVHRKPYLIDIDRSLEFDIIPFENLQSYLPPYVNVLKNSIAEVEFTEADVKEQECYEYFRANRNIIDPVEWKQLTNYPI